MPRSREPAPPAKVSLRYVGGGQFIVGVPTTDVVVDPDEAARLVATGLYAPDDEPTDEAASEEIE